MTYAVLSDIHANLPALEAVLANVQQRAVDVVYHLGDLVGYAPWPDETVDRLLDARIPGVAGNYDSTVGTGYKHCGCRYEDPLQEKLSHESYRWTLAHVSEETRAILRGLPFRIDVRPQGGHVSGATIHLIHGAPTLNTLYWTEDRPDDFCRKMAARMGAEAGDVIVFGHTHKPWTKTIDGVLFVNAGSVGRPKDGDWRACYLLLQADGGEPSAEFVRVGYEIERAEAAIHASQLPDEFATYLRTGGASLARTPDDG
jgi:predicted phosphodiesterase